MKLIFLYITGLVCAHLSYAQTLPENNTYSENEVIPILDDLSVNQDPCVKKMLKWHIENNKKRDGVEGYLVEIFFSSAMNAKELAKERKVKFLSLYPNYNVHIIYSAPNFRVRVGDFRTKSEALKLYKKIKKDYPGAFIVPGIIDFPLLKKVDYERSD
jgi:hypothetical protein